MLKVNEVFETLQGEAYWTGTPAVFVRLQGCDVGCPWCDTKYTWEIEPANEVPLDVMFRKSDETATYAHVHSTDLAHRILNDFHSSHIVITGGEPCDYDLLEFTKIILDAKRTVQIETSGTRSIRADDRSWITVSPKKDMPGGYPVLADALERANELKFPVGSRKDIRKIDAVLINDMNELKLIWLQPLSQSRKATDLCVEIARQRAWRVSFQVHKYANLR